MHPLVGLAGLILTAAYVGYGVRERNRGSRFSVPYSALGGAVVGAFAGAALLVFSSSMGHFDGKANRLVLDSALRGAFPGAAVGALAGAIVRRPWQAVALYIGLGTIVAMPLLLMALD